ncbi:unnamed protein product, partial [Ilex paraguariensis]
LYSTSSTTIEFGNQKKKKNKEKAMVKFLVNPFLLLIIYILFLAPSVCGKPTPTGLIISCLTHHGVNNFPIYPNKVGDSTIYFKLLNYSIQNLRFSELSVPKPKAIILPENKEQLLKSFLCCRKAAFEIRVRSGGHSYEGASSVATDGAPFAIIDMMNLMGHFRDTPR